MLTDPMAITIGAQAYSLKRKSENNGVSVYMDNTTVPGTEVKVTVKHSYEGKPKSTPSGTGLVQTQYERHIIDLVVTKFDANGFATVMQSYTHIRNLRGAVVASVGDVAQALAVYVNAQADNLVAWEV